MAKDADIGAIELFCPFCGEISLLMKETRKKHWITAGCNTCRYRIFMKDLFELDFMAHLQLIQNENLDRKVLDIDIREDELDIPAKMVCMACADRNARSWKVKSQSKKRFVCCRCQVQDCNATAFFPIRIVPVMGTIVWLNPG